MVARAAAVAVLLAVGSARAQIPIPPDLPQYAVLALGDVKIRRETRVLSGAVGSVAGTLRLAREARVTGVVAAPTVRLGRAVRTGNLFCQLVSGPPVLPTCAIFPQPLVDPALLAPAPVVPGSMDLRLPAHTGGAPVLAGSFRDVRVGRGSVLQLSGGEYAMESLRIGVKGRVICVAACRIGIAGAVRLGRGAELGASAPSRANTVRVDVAASGALPAFVARPRSNLSATIFAPSGDVILGALGSYRGALVGRTVTVGPQATVRGDSAL